MARGFHDTERITGRRGFFRELVLSALDTVEKAGKELSDRGLAGFREPEPPRYPPAPADLGRALNPHYTIYGPPWPPVYGPYITPELRARLRAERDVHRQSMGMPVAHGPEASD